jgi:hypothetical protein
MMHMQQLIRPRPTSCRAKRLSAALQLATCTERPLEESDSENDEDLLPIIKIIVWKEIYCYSHAPKLELPVFTLGLCVAAGCNS